MSQLWKGEGLGRYGTTTDKIDGLLSDEIVILWWGSFIYSMREEGV
jgi:hypothetical protein